MSAPSPTLTARVQAILDGPLAGLAGTTSGARSAWLLQALCDPGALAPLIRDWGEARGHTDPRVQATQWNKHFWRAVLPPWLLGALLGGEMALDRAVLLCRGRGPNRLRFEIAEADAVTHPALAFAPWAEAMARAGRMSPRVTWSNAGNLLDAAIELAPGLLPGLTPRLSMLRAQWLETPRLGNRRNPLFRPVVWHPGSPPGRVRRLCCLRYRDQTLGYCTTCPLDSAAAKRSAKRAADSGPPKNQVSRGSTRTRPA